MTLFKTYFLKNQKAIFLFLTIAGAIFIFFPTHNFQAPLSQGDHGKELYAFQQTMQGQAPYRDYWWGYGPLMPYFYGLIFKVFGVSIQNVLWGEIFLKVCAAAFFYLALAQFFTSFFAFACAIWFCSFLPPFHHSYSHMGGIPLSLFSLYMLFSYIRDQKPFRVNLAFFSAIILSLIKFNFGLASLGIMTVAFPVVDIFKSSKRVHYSSYAVKFFISLFVILAIYVIFSLGLPLYMLRQCFPFLPGDQPYHSSVVSSLLSLRQIIWATIAVSWYTAAFAAVFIFSSLYIVLRKGRDQEERAFKKDVLLAAGIVFLFIGGMLHEFFLSGAEHRIIWAKPFQLLFIFLIAGWMMHHVHKAIRWLFCLAILIIACWGNVQLDRTVSVFFKNPPHHFRINKNDVYLTNPPVWLLTVYQTTAYLNTHLKEDETFLALPYDALYYFLTNKRSPTREYIFFNQVNMTQEQEARIISELEKKGIRYILLSNRCDSKEPEFGTFGKTYCPILARYLLAEFELVETIGDWSHEPGWYEYHGIKIFKRKK